MAKPASRLIGTLSKSTVLTGLLAGCATHKTPPMIATPVAQVPNYQATQLTPDGPIYAHMDGTKFECAEVAVDAAFRKGTGSVTFCDLPDGKEYVVALDRLGRPTKLPPHLRGT